MKNSHTSTKRIRIGIVGLGMGKDHIDPFRSHPDCEVAALCDTDQERLVDTSKEFGIERTYGSLDDLLADASELDAVSIATPNFLHEPMTLAALEAGLHVLCEKPLALNAKQAERMVTAADEAGLTLGVHYNTRMKPEHQYVRAMYEAGELGGVAMVHAGWVRQRGIPFWGSGWFCDRSKSGGGALIDVGVHVIDAALSACGFPEIESVSGKTYRRFAEIDEPGMACDVDDMAVAFIRCANGTVIIAETRWASHALELEDVFCSVDGSKAGAHWRYTLQPGGHWDQRLETVMRSHGCLTRQRITEYPRTMQTVQEDFVQSIVEGREPICTGRQGLHLMRVLDAIYESCETGREVRFDV